MTLSKITRKDPAHLLFKFLYDSGMKGFASNNLPQAKVKMDTKINDIISHAGGLDVIKACHALFDENYQTMSAKLRNLSRSTVKSHVTAESLSTEAACLRMVANHLRVVIDAHSPQPLIINSI